MRCNIEGPEGVIWELGLAGFCPGKMGFKPLGLGFGHWDWEKNVKNQEWKWDLSIAKWDFKKQKMGLVPSLEDPQYGRRRSTCTCVLWIKAFDIVPRKVIN